VAQTRAFKGPLSGLPPVMHAVRWDGSTDKVFALWVDTPGASVTIALPVGTTSVLQWDGTAITTSGSSIALDESSGPIFLSVSRIENGYPHVVTCTGIDRYAVFPS